MVTMGGVEPAVSGLRARRPSVDRHRHGVLGRTRTGTASFGGSHGLHFHHEDRERATGLEPAKAGWLYCRHARVALGAGLEPATSRLTGGRTANCPTPEGSPATDSNGPLSDTGRARRRLRLRGGSRGPCCTGRQREVMSLRRETMSTLPAEPVRGLEPRSPVYGTGASPATLHRHVSGHRARPGLARTRRPSGLSTVRESNPRL